MPMTKTNSAIAGLLGAIMFVGCASTGDILGTIGRETITLKEFEDKYAKYNGGWEQSAKSTQNEREQFLDLLVRFRLKVQEARAHGLDRDSSVAEELTSYRHSIAINYLLEKELVEPNLRRAYERLNEEIRASHILIRVDEMSSPGDTLDAYERAIHVRDLIATAPFDSLARVFSDDPSADVNGGDLGYFAGGRMVPSFEDAAFALSTGEYTQEPVRTRFGYHLIKLMNRRPSKGATQLSHILVRYAEDRSDTLAVRDSVARIMAQLEEGLDFAEAARLYSSDDGSKERGGAIGEFTNDRLPAALADILYDIPGGAVAPPYETPYGFHILKVTGRRPAQSFQEVERDLRDGYQKNRYSSDYDRYVNDLKKQYLLRFDPVLLRSLPTAFDSSKTSSRAGWRDTIPSSWLGRTLYSVGTKSVTVDQFLDRVEQSDEFKEYVLTPTAVELILERISTSSVIDTHAESAAARFPEFNRIMSEYEDGVLLYRIEQDEVWQKIAVSDSLLRQYYEEHQNDFRWPDRVKIEEIFVFTKELADSLAQQARKGENFGELAALATVRPEYSSKKGAWGWQPVTANALMEIANTMPVDSISEPIAFENGWSIINVVGKDPARVKTFEEAQSEVAGAYQEASARKREEEWITQLIKTHGVSLRKDILTKAFTRKANEAR